MIILTTTVRRDESLYLLVPLDLQLFLSHLRTYFVFSTCPQAILSLYYHYSFNLYQSHLTCLCAFPCTVCSTWHILTSFCFSFCGILMWKYHTWFSQFNLVLLMKYCFSLPGMITLIITCLSLLVKFCYMCFSLTVHESL